MTTWNGRVHPIADLFPLLPEEELQDLADDIREHGLREPIVLASDGTLLDGRNRAAACERAGVAPTFITYEGEPVAFILSHNVYRRHLSKGQQAMAIIEARSCQSLTRDERETLNEQAGISTGFLAMAAVVHKHGHDAGLCAKVLDGGKLADAYEYARALGRKAEQAREWADEAEQRAEAQQAQTQAALEALRLTLEEVGPAVDVSEPPDLEPPALEVPDLAPKLANIKAESAYLKRMLAIRRSLEAFAEQEVPMGAMPSMRLGGARSWASQMVALVYGVVAAHEAAYRTEQGIRAVD
jgi:hypothetical protein